MSNPPVSYRQEVECEKCRVKTLYQGRIVLKEEYREYRGSQADQNGTYLFWTCPACGEKREFGRKKDG